MRRIAAALIVPAALLLAACGASSSTPSPSTVDSAAVQSAVRSNSDVLNATYIETLDKGGIPYASKAAAIAMAHVICTDLDSGTSAIDVAGKLANANSNLSPGKSLTDQQLGEMMGAAVQAYCPAHASELGN